MTEKGVRTLFLVAEKGPDTFFWIGSPSEKNYPHRLALCRWGHRDSVYVSSAVALRAHRPCGQPARPSAVCPMPAEPSLRYVLPAAAFSQQDQSAHAQQNHGHGFGDGIGG